MMNTGKTQQYPAKVLHAALETGVSEGLLQRPRGELELSKALESLDSLLRAAMAVSRDLAEREEKERLRPVKVAELADIPWSGDDLLFIDVTDNPRLDVLSRIHREEPAHEALCFIGAPPEWVSELVMTGHRVYELPAGTPLQIGQRALKPHPSSMGVRWLEVKYGETSIQLN